MYETLLSIQNALTSIRTIKDTLKKSLETAPTDLILGIDVDELFNIGDGFRGLGCYVEGRIDSVIMDIENK